MDPSPPPLIERELVAYPNYLEPLSFELYDYKWWYRFVGRNWHWIIYFGQFYIAVTHLVQKWMRQRAPFSLRRSLIVWNTLLSTASFLMLTRMWQELWDKTRRNGLYYAVCTNDDHSVTSSFYSLLFAFSKILEFGDTAFIVLRKRRLIFLHWYHHFTVALWGFYSFPGFDPANLAFGPLNAFIHIFMYAYYALKAAKINVPRQLAMMITTSQIVQMVFGLFIGISTAFGKGMWNNCDRTWDRILASFAMYTSYLILFLNFFLKAYFRNKNHIRKKRCSETDLELDGNNNGDSNPNEKKVKWKLDISKTYQNQDHHHLRQR